MTTGPAPIGSPPRARGAGTGGVSRRRDMGITPACAGSRASGRTGPAWSRDHPHVRGEQGPAAGPLSGDPGSPPRARGAGVAVLERAPGERITPACAGSRVGGGSTAVSPTDHPRVRGEQASAGTRNQSIAGSPPRARGAVTAAQQGADIIRITPACAGSSGGAARRLTGGPDHPRVRGEQDMSIAAP